MGRHSTAKAPRAGTVLSATATGILLAILIAAAGCGSSSPTARELGRTATRAGARPTHPHAAIGRPSRPNIVFVLTDDLAWNLVRFMPHVLAMERAGETFTNYFVTDSLCCPSRASILTGRFPHNTHVFDNSPPEGGYAVFRERGEERQTFALALRRQGYLTALMGKYLNGYRPAHDPVPVGWSEWDVAGNGYPEYGYTMNSDGKVRKYGYRARDYLTDVLARRGLAFIEHAASRETPFMLEVATFAPHSPFTPASRDAGSFPGVGAPRTPAFDAIGSNEPAWLSHFGALDTRQIAKIDRQFRRRAQAVQAVDRMIGQLQSLVAREGLAQNTYFVFSSDNGLHMGEHRLLPGKLTAFDTDINVPLVVTGPAVPAAATIGQMTENIDLCPTFDRLAGAPLPAGVDGRSLLGLLHGRPGRNWRREVLIEHHGRIHDAGDPDLPTAGAGNPPSYEAIRTPRSLYVEYATGEHEYYDLGHDPFELDNLAAALAPGKARTLHRTLLRIERCRGASSCWRAQHGAT